MSNSPYANPQPYPTVEVERAALEGRIKVARETVKRAEPRLTARQRRQYESWNDILDTLLDHLAHVEERAASARRDHAYR